MDDEQLIECVRQYEVLYDLSNPKYMDTSYKNEIWSKIAEQLKSDVAACKARWNNIRDTYRKSLKKNTTKSGQSATKKIKNYKFADQLSFINKYFEERKSKTNIEYENDEEEEENMQLDSEEQPEENLSSQPSLTSVQTNEIHVPIKTTKQKFSKTSVSQPTASARLMDYLISKKKEENQMSTGSHHPVDAFLSGIAPTLKTLSPYDLHLAKSEIFAIVQKYELQQILRRNSSTTSSMNSVTPLPSPSEDFNAHISPNQNISSASFHNLQSYYQNYQSD